MENFNEKLEKLASLSSRNEEDKERLEEIQDNIDNRNYAIIGRLKELDKQWTMVVPEEVLQPMFKQLMKRHPKYMGIEGLDKFFRNPAYQKQGSGVVERLEATDGIDMVKVIGAEYQGYFNADEYSKFIIVSNRTNGLQNLCKSYLKCLRAAGIAEKVLAVTEVYLDGVSDAWEISPNSKWGENGMGVWIIAAGMLIYSKQEECAVKDIDEAWQKLFMLYFEEPRYSLRPPALEQQYTLAEIYKSIL